MKTIEELTDTVTALREDAAVELKKGGEESREYKNVAYVLRSAERQLTSATDREKRKTELSALSPSEIVDKVMQR